MSKFSDAEISDFRETFSLFDRSGKNEILYQDVGECFRSFGFRPTNAEINKLLNSPSQDELQKKYVSFDEFLPMLAQIASEKRHGMQDFKDGLKLFDIDDNGTLPLHELRTALCSMGERLTEEEAEAVLHGMEDGNGLVDYEKLIKTVLSGAQNSS